MLEIKITVELPGVPEAISHLADAMLASKMIPNSVQTQTQVTVRPAPVAAFPEVAETEAAPAPVPEKKTRKKKEAPAPVSVELPEDAPPLANVPVEPVSFEAGETYGGEATREAVADPEVAVVEDIPQDETPDYTIDMLSRAGTILLDKGKMGELLNLLQKYKAASLMELKPEQYAAFAQDMKAIGADLP